MNKKEQLKQVLTNEGINIDTFKQVDTVNSILLNGIVGGTCGHEGCSHDKDSSHGKHDKVHTDNIFHSRCDHN